MRRMHRRVRVFDSREEAVSDIPLLLLGALAILLSHKPKKKPETITREPLGTFCEGCNGGACWCITIERENDPNVR